MHPLDPEAGSPPVAELEAPGLLSVLPLVYVAWADGILMPSEVEQLRHRLAAQEWLTAGERAVVSGWLDPTQPPTVSQYQQWLTTIREAAADLPDEARQSLSRLGVEMALRGGGDGEVGCASPEARLALDDVEAALGMVPSEVCRELLDVRVQPPDDAIVSGMDVQAMTDLLDGPHVALRHKIRTLFQDPIFRHDLERDRATYREQILTWCRLLADQGFGALAYPTAQGGQNDMAQFITAFEMIAYHDLSLVIKFGVQFGLFGGSIHQLGTEHHHRDYLPAVGRLDLPGCFAMTELNHGSNVRELETTARYDHEAQGFVIHTPVHTAHKEYIGNAALHGQLATVFAQLIIDEDSHGVHAFLVPIRDVSGRPMPGVRIEDSGPKLGLNGVDNGRLWFDQVRIPRENLLDRFAQVGPDGTYTSLIPSASRRFFTMLSTLVGGRISVARGGLSAAKSGLTIAIRYGSTRRQFGPKGKPEVVLLDYLTHQRRLLPSLATAYALHFALEDLTQRFARRSPDDDAREIEGLASGLKAFSTWNTTHTLQTCREACGGQGFMAVNRFAALKADTDVFTTFEGDNTVLMLQVAKGLLTAFKQEFHDINFFGLVKYLTEGAATTLRELNPVVTRKTDPEHLRDATFQVAAFRFREHDLLRSVARRLKARIDGGMDSYQAFIECQDHLVSLAQAHVERVVLEQFIAAIEACEAPGLREVLTLLRSLYALYHLEQDRGWFLEQGYLEGNKAKAIRREVNRLCGEVRPYAVALVDAFAIPDESLAAPIALG